MRQIRTVEDGFEATADLLEKAFDGLRQVQETMFRQDELIAQSVHDLTELVGHLSDRVRMLELDRKEDQP